MSESSCITDMSNSHPISLHLIAGALGGSAGAFVTCPLEVLKTRLQSSVSSFGGGATFPRKPSVDLTILRNYSNAAVVGKPISPGIFTSLRHIIQTEGPRALFKGLAPNLIGVAPARAIFFTVYSKTKGMLTKQQMLAKDRKLIPILSGGAAGFAAVNATCPFWVLKTRLQLDNRRSHVSLSNSIRRLYESEGYRGFYRGLFISYIGVIETMIYFTLYEEFKTKLNIQSGIPQNGIKDFSSFMIAAASARCIACSIMYPHEVIRTRIRQPPVNGVKKYNAIIPTLRTILIEEGVRALYGGLSTQLIRQIPNTATMFVVYEMVMEVLGNWN